MRPPFGTETRGFNREGADVLAAERLVQRCEVVGRKPRSDLASELLRHLSRMTAVARRYHLEAAEHEREYGEETIG